MAFAQDLLADLYTIRAIPGELGLRPYSVEAVTLMPTDDTLGGGKTERVVKITQAGGQNPKVRWLSDQERAIWQMQLGGVEVGPITPGDGVVGTLIDDLKRSKNARNHTFFRLTGPQIPKGSKFAVVDIKDDSALHYTLTLEHKAD